MESKSLTLHVVIPKYIDIKKFLDLCGYKNCIVVEEKSCKNCSITIDEGNDYYL